MNLSDRPNYPWGDNRRYNAIAKRIRETYGGRMQKVSVNAGFTCPNRDGTISIGGCIYCNNDSFVPSYCLEDSSIEEQLNRGIAFLEKRYRRPKFYAAYFQAYSNTYKPLEELKEIYGRALAHPDIHGIVISTRPDCVDDAILDYLVSINESHYLSIEYGIESCFDHTLERINRGHSFEDSKHAILRTAERGLHVTGHILFGLPGETRQEMLHEADILSGLPLKALKFHQLQVIKNTSLAREYARNPESFNFFEMDEYIEFIIAFLERLNPMIAVERLVSEAPPVHRVNPGWGNKRSDWIQKKIESVMEEKDTWQGKQFKKSQKFLT